MGTDLFGHTYSEEHYKQMIQKHDQEPFSDVNQDWFEEYDSDQLEFDFEKEIGLDMQQKVDKLTKMSYTKDNA